MRRAGAHRWTCWWAWRSHTWISLAPSGAATFTRTWRPSEERASDVIASASARTTSASVSSFGGGGGGTTPSVGCGPLPPKWIGTTCSLRSDEIATSDGRDASFETARSWQRGPCHDCRTAPDPASHKKRFLSTPADTKWRPSGSHAHAVTAPPCRAYVRRHSAVRTRQSLIRWSFAQVSSESSSEGAQATNAREASWPRSSLSLGTEGCVTSHTTTTLSFDADASSAPEGENWTNHTSSVCPSSTWRVDRGTSSRDAEKSSKRETPARRAGGQRRWWPADAAAAGCVCQSIAWWRRVRSRSSGSSSDGGT